MNRHLTLKSLCVACALTISLNNAPAQSPYNPDQSLLNLISPSSSKTAEQQAAQPTAPVATVFINSNPEPAVATTDSVDSSSESDDDETQEEILSRLLQQILSTATDDDTPPAEKPKGLFLGYDDDDSTSTAPIIEPANKQAPIESLIVEEENNNKNDVPTKAVTATVPSTVGSKKNPTTSVYTFDLDTFLRRYDSRLFIPTVPLPGIAFLPIVFDRIDYLPSAPDLHNSEPILADSIFGWIKADVERNVRLRALKQAYMVSCPANVHYNINTLPAPPKKYIAEVDPQKATIKLREENIKVSSKTTESDITHLDIIRRNWLNDFNASLQFSQAFVSPNWYQGGNNNTNAIGSTRWNVKLNNKFYPNLIAEATTLYKLAITSAPQDSIHGYAISEDLFQFNGTAGVKAFKRWYYSVNGTFKTQFLRNYKTNSRTMKAAFLSPGELNVGLGMTYNFSNNASRRFSFNASIAPLSYNLKIALSDQIPSTNFGVPEGELTKTQIGSNAEIKVNWDILWNVNLNSRLFVFTDYNYMQSDWQNTVNIAVNRYFSTQIYFHVRHDTSAPINNNKGWGKWQLKEILSFGLQYQFRTA